MRKNLPVTNREYPFKGSERLISSTDAKGIIKHCNEAFVEMSGYERDELIGSPHNLIRHPDMPKPVFAEMWSTLQKGRVWMGLVKNRRKNGDHYWVSAFVTPVFEADKLVGYESVRVAADESEKKRAEKAYKRLSNGQSSVTWTEKLKDFVAQTLSVFVPAILASIVLGVFHSPSAGLISAGFGLLSVFWVLFFRYSEWKNLMSISPQSYSNVEVAQTYFPERGVAAQAKLVLATEIARSRTALTRINDSVTSLDEITDITQTEAKKTASAVEEQGAATQQIASAITEMSQAIQEVAEKIESNSSSAETAIHNVDSGVSLAGDALKVIHNLNDSVKSIAVTVQELADSTGQIGQAADLITTIADQTNLLALNAAIEAARAGEHGRGFSVVADEVRALASKTRESTDQIHNVVQDLSKRASSAVAAAKQGQIVAGDGVQVVDKTKNALSEIRDAVKQITDMTFQMSAAVEEQSSVADHINQQIVDIADGSNHTREASAQSLEASHKLESTVSIFRSLISRFAIK